MAKNLYIYIIGVGGKKRARLDSAKSAPVYLLPIYREQRRSAYMRDDEIALQSLSVFHPLSRRRTGSSPLDYFVGGGDNLCESELEKKGCGGIDLTALTHPRATLLCRRITKQRVEGVTEFRKR